MISFSGPIIGPSVLIIGGTHGNERTGIAVIEQLRKYVVSDRRSIASGTLTLALGNPRAVTQNIRAIDGRDLNRYFSTEMLTADDGSEEFKRASILANTIQAADVIIDIHATNKPSVPFVTSKNDEAHRNVLRWFHPTYVLTDPEYIFGGGSPVTIDEYADSIGKIGLCFETGWVNDESIIPTVTESAIQYLTDIGILFGEKVPPPKSEAAIYEIITAILRDDRVFSFAEGRGMSSFEPISSGDIIGYHGEGSIAAEHDGVIIFPKLPEHQIIGKPVCYLAKQVK